jgi:Sec-independent protein secretion pathway component TatC
MGFGIGFILGYPDPPIFFRPRRDSAKTGHNHKTRHRWLVAAVCVCVFVFVFACVCMCLRVFVWLVAPFELQTNYAVMSATTVIKTHRNERMFHEYRAHLAVSGELKMFTVLYLLNCKNH